MSLGWLPFYTVHEAFTFENCQGETARHTPVVTAVFLIKLHFLPSKDENELRGS
jgi:hypothetical protein